MGARACPLRAVRAVLLEWMRAAELSCDRAATLAVRDPRIVCRTLMVMAGGMPADKLDLDAFMAQAMEYENWEDSHDRVRRFFIEINATHSYAVRRVSEVMRWVQSGEYDRIVRGEYRRRGEETDVREEAGEAMEFYAERFRAMFRELGDNVTSLGSQVGDVSQQVADWLRNRGGSGGFDDSDSADLHPLRRAGAGRARSLAAAARGRRGARSSRLPVVASVRHATHARGASDRLAVDWAARNARRPSTLAMRRSSRLPRASRCPRTLTANSHDISLTHRIEQPQRNANSGGTT